VSFTSENSHGCARATRGISTRALACAVDFAVVLAASGMTAAASNWRTIDGLVTPAEFERYANAFITEDGRVVDRENGNVTHSEAQGYGMLLAVRASERDVFDRIWSFTRRNMQIRSDALIAWRWDPHSTPRVTDSNNASDGDILIACALLEAALRWDEPRYVAAADLIILDIGRKLVATHEGRTILSPAAFGFDSIPGNHGPVINLSYWIYEAFPLFEAVRPEFPWSALRREGMAMTQRAQHGSDGLVPDWARLDGARPLPARGFAPRFSYDAVRVPLYLAASGEVPTRILRPFDEAFNRRGDGAPEAVNLRSGRTHHRMNEPGYRMIAALVACATRGRPVGAALSRFRPTTYFASTLHLLALSAVRAHHPRCMTTEAVEVASTAPDPRSRAIPSRRRRAVRTRSGVHVPPEIARQLGY
jgi:endoglucanase